MTIATDYLWPTKTQMLLLRAALADGEAARLAYDRWCDAVDLAGPVDIGSLGLLPLAHANLATQAEDLPHAGLIAGVRRRSFVETQRALSGAAQAAASLAEAGIRAMVIKGVPLAQVYYAAPGLRPMSDADILVEQHRAEEALDVLQAVGWRSPIANWPARRAVHMKVCHAVALERGPGAAVDLHWRPLHETLPAQAEQQLWSRAVPIEIAGVATLRPDATALLMQVLLHGLRSNAKAPLRWIPDALMILRKDGPHIDWDRLVETSRRGRMLNRLGLALGFLHEAFAAPIPGRVLREVGRSNPTLVEHLENQRIMGRLPGPLGMYCYKAAVLLRMAMSGPRSAIPGLLWLKIMQHAPANRA